MSFSHSFRPQAQPQGTKPIPRYLLPNEVTVFWTLLRLRPIGGNELELPIRQLAKEAHLSYSSTYQAVEALALNGYLRCAPSRIIHRPSRFRLLYIRDPRYPSPAR